MSSWENIEFGKLATFRNGLNFSRESHGEGCKIIGVSDFGDKLIPEYGTLGEINPDGIIKADDYLEKGDILFVRSNGNKNLVGRSLFISENNQKMVFSGFCIRARISSSNVEPLFYAYFFRTSLFRKLISAAAGGANIQNLNQGLLYKAQVPFPPLATQRRIASILSDYDNLIENNLKRIKLLEELAQRTYEEWFVKFTINGEKLEVNNETGLPEGWSDGTINDLIGFQSGFAYKSSRFVKSGYPIIKIRNIGSNTVDLNSVDFIDTEYAASTVKFKLKSGDLLIAMTGATVGKVGYVPRSDIPLFLNQRVGRFLNIDNKKNIHFVFSIMTVGNGLQQVLNLASGAAQPNISGNQILSLKTVIPPHELLSDFNNFSESNVFQILNFQNQNRLLKEARDILLPRLMSGAISVEEAEVEMSMAAEPSVKYDKD